jgi:hypothetical protein
MYELGFSVLLGVVSESEMRKQLMPPLLFFPPQLRLKTIYEKYFVLVKS